jgi:hypothetical protein
MAELEEILSDDEWRSLADDTRKERRAVVASALVEEQSEIDEAPPGEQGIATIDQIVKHTLAWGLDIKQRKDLTDYAQARNVFWSMNCSGPPPKRSCRRYPKLGRGSLHSTSSTSE